MKFGISMLKNIFLLHTSMLNDIFMLYIKTQNYHLKYSNVLC